MKLVCISDTHRMYKRINVPKGDVFIHAGDIEIYNCLSELRDFNKWLDSLPHKHKIVIAGNHDRLLDIHSKKCIRGIFTNAIYLENSGCTIDGIKFWGSPITPAFLNWFFMAARGKEIQNKYWSKIPRNTDVLITHGPPYGIMDEVIGPEKHAGCSDLLWTIEQLKPKVHIFGHIHSRHGVVKKKDTTFINASVVNEEYRITYKPIEIKIK